eukprot:350837_1
MATKQEITELWGLSETEIDSKVAAIKEIIGSDVSDGLLLHYLLHADLNISHAVALHFENTPSLPHSLQSDETSHNHNSNTHSTNNHNNPQRDLDDSQMDIDDHALMDVDDDDEDSEMEILNLLAPMNRKRTFQELSDEQSDDMAPIGRASKRRRMHCSNPNSSGSSDSNSNSNNRNTNTSTAATEHKQDTEPMQQSSPSPSVQKTAWAAKTFGSLQFEVSCKCPDLYDPNIRNFADELRNKTIKIDVFDRVSHLSDKRKSNKLYLKCIEELQGKPIPSNSRFTYQASTVCVSIPTKTVISENASAINTYEETYQKQLQKAMKDLGVFRSKQGWYQKQVETQVRCAIAGKKGSQVCSKYSVKFKVAFHRRNSSSMSLKCDIPYTIALLGGSKDLLRNIMATIKMEEKHTKQKGHTFTMTSLLDVACRDKYKISNRNNNQSYNHGLNVSLHPYQLQSLNYMMEEENDAVGFYRHFFEEGTFQDNTSFRYSAVFRTLVLDESSLIAHGGFLCEEMGLGKTIISLALIQCNKPQDLTTYSTQNELQMTHSEPRSRLWKMKETIDPTTRRRIKNRTYYYGQWRWYKSSATLVIAPVSLIGQWEKECDEKSGGKLRYKRYYGSRSRDVKKYMGFDIIFTTYGILSQEDGMNLDLHVLHQIEWQRILLDESHYIKNGNCRTSRNVNTLRGINKWCLTGTPFGRQVRDIGNQLRFIGMQQEHVNAVLNNVSIPHIDNPWGDAKSIVPMVMVIQSMVMRHTKAQMFNGKPIVSLPDKEEDVIFVQFTEKQRIYYDKLYNIAKERFSYYKATRNIGRGSISILAGLHPARQACSGNVYTPSDIEEELAKAQIKTLRVQSMVNSATKHNLSRQQLFKMAKHEAFNYTDDGECPICYECPFDEPLQTPCRHIFCGECIRSVLDHKSECPMCRKKVIISQLRKPPSREDDTDQNNKNHNQKEEKGDDDEDDEEDKIRFDSKLKVLVSELNKIRETKPNDKVLIFTSFSKSLDWMCSELQKNGFEYRTLTGSMSMNKRKKQLAQFGDNPNVKVFVLTVRSGAVGITLTAANHVFMLEPPFNAALHRQAINRVYRLGQKKKVFIHTLIMKDSIEERIWNLNKEKQNQNQINRNQSNSLAGNISRDKSANLKQHEIEKLFE